MAICKQLFDQHSQHLDKPHTGEISSWSEFEAAANMIEDVLLITKPLTIFEIGFNRGASSLLWLLTSNATVYSLDIIHKKKSVDYLMKEFGYRFAFVHADSKDIKPEIFEERVDLVFIDGAHTYNAVSRDIEVVLRNVVPDYILFDDYFHTPDMAAIQKAVSERPELKIIKTYHNQVLCKVIHN